MGFQLLDQRIVDAISKRGFNETDIQKDMIPLALAGKNVLGIAPTGTGKTEAALLPVLHQLLRGEKNDSIEALYITPLRALNRDMLSRIEWWGEELGISVGVRHGDTSQSDRTKQLKKPPRLLVTTPESLNAMLCAPKMGEKLAGVKCVIIDEVHEMAESKRGVQLVLELERLAARAGDFQRLCLSATIGDPKYIAEFMFSDRPYELVKVPLSKDIEISVENPSPNEDDRKQSVKLSTTPVVAARLRRMSQLLREHKGVLTFVNTRSNAEMLSSRLAAYEKDHKVDVHHSSLSKDVRVLAEKGFKSGETKALISTSSLELGIDIGKIDLVVQYTSPRQAKRLIQRVGRSGHQIGRITKGIILSTDAEDSLEAAVITKLALEGKLENSLIWQKPLDILAHELVGLALEHGQMKILDALALARKAKPYQSLTLDEFALVLKQLGDEHLIWVENERFGRKKTSRMYYYSNLSTIADEQKFFVKDVTMNKNIATLDESFVAGDLERGGIFVAKGQAWRVLDITDREVLVEPRTDMAASIPAWEGENIPVSYEVARSFAEHMRSGDFKRLRIDKSAEKALDGFKQKQDQSFTLKPDEMRIEMSENYLSLVSFNGSKINETIGKYLSALISSYLGHSVRMRSDPYRIMFEFPSEPRPDLVEKFLTDDSAVENVVEQTSIRSSLFKSKFIHVSKRFGLLDKHVSYNRISIGRIMDAVTDSPVFEETMNEIKTQKYDVEGTEKVLEQIRKGKIKVITNAGKMSLFSGNAFDKILYMPELMRPNKPESQLISILKERVSSSTAKMYCTYCGNIFYSKVDDLPDEVKCQKCGSSMIAFVKQEKKSYEILEKARKKKHMAAEEKRFMKELMETANLINAYGKKAIKVLMARGVGPENAKRVLGKLHRTEEDMYHDVLEAQRNFYKTKQYWH